MKIQCFMDLTFETETLDECSQSYGIRVKTPLENVGKYRKSKIDMTQLTETIDQEVASYKVRFNIPKFHLLS
jgi:NAD(P)-dependent dehydrogenase (short-subunit alcohol dehydrogenase family)